MNDTKPVIPIIHLNGTSREALINLRFDYLHKLDEARKALVEMAPHGRDYYLIPGLYELAREQHLRRINAICALLEDIEAEILALQALP